MHSRVHLSPEVTKIDTVKLVAQGNAAAVFAVVGSHAIYICPSTCHGLVQKSHFRGSCAFCIQGLLVVHCKGQQKLCFPVHHMYIETCKALSYCSF